MFVLITLTLSDMPHKLMQIIGRNQALLISPDPLTIDLVQSLRQVDKRVRIEVIRLHCLIRNNHILPMITQT